MKKNKYICPQTIVVCVSGGCRLLSDSDRETGGNGPTGSVTDGPTTPPPPGGTAAKRYNAWSSWDE